MPLPTSRIGRYSTVASITLTVNGGSGSDTPSANRPKYIVEGDYSAYPFATIPAAIDSLPRILRHTVTINVAAGNYGGFYVEGFHCGKNAYLQVIGARGTFTPTTGPSTDISPSVVSGRTITKIGDDWTVDDLVGKYVEVTSGPGAGQVLIIAANDADSLKTATIPSPALTTGSVFTIVEHKTVVDTAYPGGLYGVGVFNNVGYIYIIDVKSADGTFRAAVVGNAHVLLNRVLTDGGDYGILGQDGNIVAFSEIGAIGATYYGITVQNCGMGANAVKGWMTIGCGYGIYINAVPFTYVSGVYLRNTTYYGIYATYDGLVRIQDFVIDSAQTGIFGWSISFLYPINGQIDNMTIGCFSLRLVRGLIWGPLTGSGNAGWGLYAFGSGNLIEIGNTLPTISGAAGEVTVDGTTDVTWTALSAAGEYAVDVVRGARINRV